MAHYSHFHLLNARDALNKPFVRMRSEHTTGGALRRGSIGGGGGDVADQPTFADLDYNSKKRKTRREVFLKRMERLVPWEQLEGLIRPY